MPFDPINAVGFAFDGKPDEFNNTIKDTLADRILDSIEAKRQEMSANLFGADYEDKLNGVEETPEEPESSGEPPEETYETPEDPDAPEQPAGDEEPETPDEE